MTSTTENNILAITTDERAKLEESSHPLLAALAKAESEGGTSVIAASAWLTNWRRNQNDPEYQAAKIQKLLASKGKPAQEQASLMQWCGFPTDMTRVSPFFPTLQNEMKDRPFLRDFLITAANWGEIRYTGPKLSIYEEDSLLALLALLELATVHRIETQDEGRKTYTYCGPALPLLKILGHKQPSVKAYKQFFNSLKMLSVAGVELKIAAGAKKGKRKEPRYIAISTMLSNVAWDEEKKELSATINPYFFETFFSGRVTLMDVQKRMAISGSIAKGLYRFVQSHASKTPLWQGHFLTLAQTLNMNTEQPAFRLRSLLKKAINELISQGILTQQSGIIRQDIVTLYRADEVAFPKQSERKQLKN